MILFHLQKSDYGSGPSNMRLRFGWCWDPCIDASIHSELSNTGMRDCEIQDEELPPTLRYSRFYQPVCLFKDFHQDFSTIAVTRRSETEEAEDAEDEAG